MAQSTVNKTLMNIFGLAVIINGFIVFAEYLAVAPIGTSFLLDFIAFAFLPMVAAFLAIPVSLVLLFLRRYRIIGIKLFLGCLIYLIVGIACIRLHVDIRHNGFVNLAHRSRTLVSAIQQFETKYGKPPYKLEQLVPEFLPAVPKTGMGAYPNYEYLVVKDQTAYEGNPWVLKVQTPGGGLNWDMFLYLPKQNYPQAGYGGVLERIEDWAYVHE